MPRAARRPLQQSSPTPASGLSPAPRLGTSSAAATSAIVPYSCLSCKQRKVRCSRQSPCVECVRTGVECVPSSRKPYSARKRRRGLEDAESPEQQQRQQQQRGRNQRLTEKQEDGRASMQRTQAPGFGQNLWTGLQEEFREPQTFEIQAAEDTSATAAAGRTPVVDPYVAFVFGQNAGAGLSHIDLKSAHPQPVHAFVLWQTFLQSINPLSKVVYAPQIQDLVIQATGGYDSLSTAEVALLFAIYAAAVSALPEDDCQAKLGEPKRPLLEKYLACAQQALATAGLMWTTSLVLLQAFTLFLLAARQNYNPNAMWILTGMAVRMGQRLLATEPPQADGGNGSAFFETQMRLRVWWQIMLLDGRTAQLSGQTRMFNGDMPDYPLPANLNDSDINPKMTGAPPPILDRPTEMIFCLLRYEMGKQLIIQGRTLHDPTATIAQRDAVLDEVAAFFQDKYIALLDPAIPVHQIAEAGARAAINKLRLMAHHPGQYPDKGKSMPQAEHDMLFETSVNMVDVLVQGFSATHLAHFKWHIDVYFQLDAVVFMLIESQSQPPHCPLVDKAWALVDVVLHHKRHLVQEKDELGRAVRQLVLRAWESRVRRARLQNQKSASAAASTPTPPDTVAELLAEARRRREARHRQKQRANGGEAQAKAQAEAQADDEDNEPEPEGENDGEVDDETPAHTNSTNDGGVAVAETKTAPVFEDAMSELALPLDLQYPTTTSSSLDASPFSSYTDMDVLGWEPTDWDSWDNWNTLLQSQIT